MTEDQGTGERSDASALDSEAMFRSLAENLPSICWVSDAAGGGSWYNRMGETYFGRTGLTNADLGVICHPDDLERVSAVWGEAMAAGRPLELMMRLRGPGGRYEPFLSRATPVHDTAGKLIRWCGIATNISAQQAETDRRDFLDGLAERLRDELDAKAVLDITAEQLGRRLAADRVAYSEIELGDAYMTVESDWTSGAVPSMVGRHALAGFGEALEADHRAGNTLVANDMADHPLILPQVAARLRPLGIAACIDVPLVRGGRCAAVLHVHQAQPRAWTAEEVRLVEEVADRTWATLNRARAEAKLRARERDQAFLLAWSDSVREETSSRGVLARTLSALGEHLGVARVNFAEADATGETLLVEQDWTDGLHSVQGQRFPLAALGEAVVAGHLVGAPFCTNDVQKDDRFGPHNLAVYDAVGARAFVSVPLVKAGRLLAVLSVQQPKPRHWSDDEVRLLADVAERTWATLERAHAEERLRESEALLAAFMENAPIGMFVKDVEGRYLRLNSEMGRAMSVKPAEAVGRTTGEVMGAGAPADVAAQDAATLAGAVGRYELHYPGQADYTDALVIRFPIRLDEGQPVTRTGGFAIDLSDRKRAEAELQRSRDALHQTEKLTALGSLLAGVSHELNNPLSIVVAQAVMMERQASNPKLAERAGKIRRAAERCAKIVQTFLAMARRKAPVRTEVQLNDVARAALELTEYGLRTHGVTVETALAPDLPPLFADADQLHQVLINLIINAQHAMGEVDGERRLRVATGRAEDGRLTLEIADNGPGVPADIRRRIFEPFFTTKAQSTGTGVGLSFSQGLVEAHGGRLELLDTPTGATFRVTLPLGSGEASTPELDAGSTGEAVGLRALIVDDEPEIAEALGEFLELEGYTCELAESGRAATERLKFGRYDLVVSDLRMPDMDGPALFAWLKRERPDLAGRTVFSTGDTLGAPAARFIADAGRPVIEKPFTPESVSRVLGQLG